MNRILWIAVSLAVCAGCVTGRGGDTSDWEMLVEGKSLKGWVKRGGTAAYRAKDGVVTGMTSTGSPNTFLCTERAYGDFVLELEFKAHPEMNSGIQIRSESHGAYNDHRVHGYQVEIASPGGGQTGGIYDEARRKWLAKLDDKSEAPAAFKEGEWNKFRIEAIGDSIKTWLNDVPAADLTDSFTAVGFIALQVHGTKSKEKMDVMWRNIRIKDLDRGKASPSEVYARCGDWKSGGADGPVAQVIALGRGKYRARILKEFDSRDAPVWVMNGKEIGRKVVFKSGDWWGEIKGNTFVGGNKADMSFKMARIFMQSSTLGEKPPDGAVVLFDGTSLDEWETVKGQSVGWKLVDGGAMEVLPGTGTIKSRRKFSDAMFHIEFRSPFSPDSFGQARGNSGVYLQGRYEIQVLDSYGLEGLDNECGGIYKVSGPRVNMCAPPLVWQTYDMTYRAPRFDKDGKKVRNARVTVVHNGVTIHENLELPKPTGGALGKEDSSVPEPLVLQEHKNLVQYRNIWAVRLEPGK